MPRIPGADDQDWAFLDRVISLALDIVQHQQDVKEICDEPDVLRLALYTESDALLIQKLAKDYRPRLEALKKKSRPAVGEQRAC